VTRWSDSEIQGRVGASLGVSDLKAAITLYPGGRSVADAITSDQGPSGTRRTPWRFRFTATRVEQTISAASINPQVLTSNYASPAPQLLTQGNRLLNGWAVSRTVQSTMKGALCSFPHVVTDSFKLKMAAGFELVEVKMRDLHANTRHGLRSPDSCELRSTSPAPQPMRTARDGSFQIQSTWNHVARIGPVNDDKTNLSCGSYFYGPQKSPLGLGWEDGPKDFCASNAEYAVDAFVFRGPAGLNPFFGTPDGAVAVIK
jgi:hypothetical protein